VCVWYNG